MVKTYLFSQYDCEECIKLKELLNEGGFEYENLDVATDPDSKWAWFDIQNDNMDLKYTPTIALWDENEGELIRYIGAGRDFDEAHEAIPILIEELEKAQQLSD